MNSNWPGGSRAYKETTAILLNENKESGPAEALRQRRLLPQWFFPVKIYELEWSFMNFFRFCRTTF